MHRPRVVALALIAAGCGLAGAGCGVPPRPTPAMPAASTTLSIPTPAGMPRAAGNPVLLHSVTLPDGTTLASGPATATVPDVALQLETIGVARDRPTSDVPGNHIAALSSETEQLPVGTATMFTVRRTPPAASPELLSPLEYWVVVRRRTPQWPQEDLAYAIVGTVTGNATDAKRVVLQVARTWRLPA